MAVVVTRGPVSHSCKEELHYKCPGYVPIITDVTSYYDSCTCRCHTGDED